MMNGKYVLVIIATNKDSLARQIFRHERDARASDEDKILKRKD
ncbi:hypothetical protein Flavo103_11300 [Flavobacterium collinsii]|nr:hypothetical protein Flavo103_11300 [Flavobacterium collinsii]